MTGAFREEEEQVRGNSKCLTHSLKEIFYVKDIDYI